MASLAPSSSLLANYPHPVLIEAWPNSNLEFCFHHHVIKGPACLTLGSFHLLALSQIGCTPSTVWHSFSPCAPKLHPYCHPHSADVATPPWSVVGLAMHMRPDEPRLSLAKPQP